MSAMVATVQDKFDTLAPMMNENLRRRWAACEALALGRGGVSAVSKATGISRTTIHRAIHEVRHDLPEFVQELAPGRVRQPGGGRRSLATADETLMDDLKSLLEGTTRGDPTCPLLWTCKSTRKLAEELQREGHTVSHMTIARLISDMGYNLQANRKTLEGAQNPDRDAQFQHISAQVKAFQKRGQPVISVDAKKRELVGDFKNGGREWLPQGSPLPVRMHDFRDPNRGVAIPYGVYDLTRNEGWVSVGLDHDTAQFATATIERWWRRMGRHEYPTATRLLITADGGGSNGSRNRLWKWCLQQLADKLNLEISVCHFPPGTSKWNKIEHRMFCHITENWRGRPLVSRAVVVNLIGNVHTRPGLRIKADVDEHAYPRGITVPEEELANINIKQAAFHGDWNYTISPHQNV
jgi:Rhodopirellula transposase DDE domain